MWGGRRPDRFDNRSRPQRPNRNDYGVPFDARAFAGDQGFPQAGNLPYTADELRALADRMDASGGRRGNPGMGMPSQDAAYAGRALQKPDGGADHRPSRDAGNGAKSNISPATRSGSRGVTGSAPRPQPAPRPDAKPMLTQDAYIKRQQLRWLLKKRLGQVRDALAAMQTKGVQRTAEGLKANPETTPGLFAPTIKGDFEHTFARQLSYKEFGVDRLGQLLQRECDDIVQEPQKISQFMPMVKGQSTVPSGGETKAASRMAGRQHAPALHDNTALHITRVLRHFGYPAADITAYAKTLPQPKAKADKAQKAKAAAAVAAAAAADGEQAAAPAAASGAAQEAEEPSKHAAAAGKAEEPAGAPAEAAVAGEEPDTAQQADADAAAADTLVESNANVLGMASDDEDMQTAAAAAPDQGGGLTGTKRKAADGGGGAHGDTLHAGSAKSTFWDAHPDRELSEVERDFIVGLRARLFNYAFYSTTAPPFMLAVADTAAGGPARKKRRRNQQSAAVRLDEHGPDDAANRRLRLSGLEAVHCPKGSARHAMLEGISPGVPPHARKGGSTTLACDVSDVLEDMLAEILAADSVDGNGSAPQECLELCQRVRAAPEWFLGLAALPLTLCTLPDGRLVVAPATDALSPDHCIAARRLRQAAVVSMLDVAPGMREALGGAAAAPPVVERQDEAGTTVLCLPVAEVARRMEGIIRPDLLKLLLAAVRCDSAEQLLASVHVADLVHRLPADPSVVCASFGPFLDLRLTLDRRLAYLSAVAAAAAGGDAAAVPLRKASYSVPLLLKDHGVMWGYTFVPQWTGVDGIAQVVRGLLGDMVAEVRPGPQALVRASQATLLRHLLRAKLDDIVAAAAEAGGSEPAAGDGKPAEIEVGGAVAEPEAQPEAPSEAQPTVEAVEAATHAEEKKEEAPVAAVVKQEVAEEADVDTTMADVEADVPAEAADAAAAEAGRPAGEEPVAAAADAATALGEDVAAPAGGHDVADAGGAGATKAEGAEAARNARLGAGVGVHAKVKQEPADEAAAAGGPVKGAVGQERLRGAGGDAGCDNAEGGDEVPAEGAADGTSPAAEEAAEGAAAALPASEAKPAAAGGDAAVAEEAQHDDDVIMLGDTDDEDAGRAEPAVGAAQAGGAQAGAAEGDAVEGPPQGGSLAGAEQATAVINSVSVKQEAAGTPPDEPKSAAAVETAGVSAVRGVDGGARAEADAERAASADAECAVSADGAAAGEPAQDSAAAQDGAGQGPEAGGTAAEPSAQRDTAGADQAAADPAAAAVHVIDDDDSASRGSAAVAGAGDAESGGSTGVVAAHAARRAENGGDEDGEITTPRDDAWVVLRMTQKELRREYEARYGVQLAPAASMKEVLRAVEWEFEVEWEEGGAALAVRDRLEKQGLQKPVPEAQRAVLQEYLRQAHVLCEPAALYGAKAKPAVEDKAGAGGKDAAGGKGGVLGKRKEAEGAAAAPASKVGKPGERAGPGQGRGKGPEGIRGRSGVMPMRPVQPMRPTAPLRTAVGYSGARGGSAGPVPPRRNSPMPRANLRPVPVQAVRRPVPDRPVQPMPAMLRQPTRQEPPSRYPRSQGRPPISPMQRERPGVPGDKRGRDGYWQQGSRPSHGPSPARHEDVGGYVRGSGAAQRAPPDVVGHRGTQDRYRREPSPGAPGGFDRGGYRRRSDGGPSPAGRYLSGGGARGGSMLDEPRHAGSHEERYERRAPVQDSTQAQYAVDARQAVPGLAGAGTGYVTVVPGSVYGARQVGSAPPDVAAARYAAPTGAADIQSQHAAQPATVQVLAAPAAAQAGNVYRLATMPDGATVLINASAAVDGTQSVQSVQQGYTQAYAQYAVEGFGRVQQQQPQRAAQQYADVPVRRDSDSLQQYSVQAAPNARPSRQYTQDRYY
eukprot:jgi/Ulvmu1/744/UM010_0117.1